MTDFASESGHLEKRCRTCGLVKSLSMFSKREGSTDGYRNDCKECRASKQRIYSKTDSGRSVQSKADKIRHQKFKAKRCARSTLFRAVSLGEVEKLPCWVCGEVAEAHHPDYSSPLDVVWLCKPHHKQVHEMARGENG